MAKPGKTLAFLEPLFEGGLDGVTPGSGCIIDAFTSNHDRLVNEELGFVTRTSLHVVDTAALVHAMILRVEVLLLPIKSLAPGGH